MTAFVQTFPSHMADFAFSGFDPVASTPSSGCLNTPPSYRINTDSPTCRNNMAFQPMAPFTESYFFDEAINTSEVPSQADYSYSPISPRTVTAAQFPENPETQQVASPVMASSQRAPPQLRAPVNPLEVEVKLEEGISDPAEDESKGARRVRKTRGRRRGSSRTLKQEDSDVEVHSKDPRRNRILERNRIAATKCRMRKRDEASALATKEQEMEEQNRLLSRTYDNLAAEIYHLKTQLLQHTDCNCVLIQKYIAHEARKSVNGLPYCPSPFQPNMNPLAGYQTGSNGSRASVTSISDSYGIRTPDVETGPPIWPEPVLHASNSPEAMFEMGLEPAPKEHISVPSQTMHGVPAMHEPYPAGQWVANGHQYQTTENNGLWAVNWGFPCV